MKKIKIPLIAALAIGIAFSACQNESQEAASANTADEAAVAKLLDRNERIRYDKEWDQVQNYYVKFREAIQKEEDDAKDRLAMADLFINEARITGEHGHYYPAALEVLAGIPESHPDKDIRFRKLSTQASVELSLHDFQKALKTAEAAVAINPYNAQIYGALVDANVELGHYEEAVKMADKMVSIRPDMRSYARVSYLREIHGQVEGALEAMQLAVDAGYPGYEATAWARLTLGEMYERYGMLKEAEAQYNIILAEREDYPFAIASLANLEMGRGNYEKAEQMLKDACEIIPEFGFYEQLAEIYKTTGRTAEFEATMDELWVMLKDDTDSGHDMSLEYANLYSDLSGEQEKALEYALGEYEKRPANIDVNRVLAKIYSRMGKVDEATAHLQKAQATNAKYPELDELKQQLASR
ncbi:tetratricopeptide repeat protein [Phaeodactylibacter luteus]|uniref:Tetratricopeptide repeat protein n=1 Tax=Phaeodactylibacter luteus TaxID=1564516 RepID=A0A5C6S6Z7_9BACT|nr:tetratricopeptide repeat protein [Phaeodactylibacter luteus]TXB70270.1 tetratricopeptide repeat protein [Phaeodactylibacter luteus]